MIPVPALRVLAPRANCAATSTARAARSARSGLWIARLVEEELVP